jgi:hypothetical protein
LNAKLTGVSLIAAAALAAFGCGSEARDTTTPATSTGKAGDAVSIRQTPSYKSAEAACGAVPAQTLAGRLGVATTDPEALARKYAERNAPLAQRQDVYEGCLAALTR